MDATSTHEATADGAPDEAEPLTEGASLDEQREGLGDAEGEADASEVDAIGDQEATADEAPSKGSEPDGAQTETPTPVKPKRKSKPTRLRRPVRWGRVFAVLGIIIGVGLIAALVTFLVFRWGMSDDANAIEGQWLIDGTDTVITFTDNEIVLSNDLTFTYEIDPFAKTITFHFSDLDGGGHFRFSLDGNRLAIRDGTYSAWDTLIGDIPFSFGLLIDQLTGAISPLFSDDSGVTYLTRVGTSAVNEPTPESAPAPSEPAPAPEPETTPTPAPETAESGGEADENAATDDTTFESEVVDSLGEDPETEAGAGAL